LFGLGVVVVVVLMMRACDGDGDANEDKRHSNADDMPRQAIVVQIPAAQWPQPAAQLQPQVQQQLPGAYGAPPPVQPHTGRDNPWAVRQQPTYAAGAQSGQQQWGRVPPSMPQQYEPSVAAQYRPLQNEQQKQLVPQPAPQLAPPVQGYWPTAPYDRLSGSSFGTPAYPYGAYPGYYGAPGIYGAPGVYNPGWPVTVPGGMWPGHW
jgi:hypothetical protein